MSSLSVSVVTYAPDIDKLRDTLKALSAAAERAMRVGLLESFSLEIIDNGPGSEWAKVLDAESRFFDAQLLSGHGNIGYGRGHNLALLSSCADYHLVLNPDVTMDPDAIEEALGFMIDHPSVVILSPLMRGQDGSRQFLCKRYPSVLDLALRGFAPGWLKRRFRERLSAYELRDLSENVPHFDMQLLSGSFMFCRTAPIAEIHGFSEDYFVYFEDFDLSLRARNVGKLAFVPKVKAIHFGGNASRKGWHHRILFVAGAYRFFCSHGWKWL